jgi:hypothetical protein
MLGSDGLYAAVRRLPGCCLAVVWLLPGCCLAAAWLLRGCMLPRADLVSRSTEQLLRLSLTALSVRLYLYGAYTTRLHDSHLSRA